MASSFEEFLATVADDRWLWYLKGQTHDQAGTRLVQSALKLEEPEAIERYFSIRLGRPFRIGHANPSRTMQIVWPAELKRRYYGLLADDCETFGYTPLKDQ